MEATTRQDIFAAAPAPRAARHPGHQGGYLPDGAWKKNIVSKKSVKAIYGYIYQNLPETQSFNYWKKNQLS